MVLKEKKIVNKLLNGNYSLIKVITARSVLIQTVVVYEIQ